MIRILHVVSVMDVGGMESFIMNIYRLIDRSEIQFDFLVHHGRRGVFEDEIEALGGRIYHTTLMDDLNIFKYKRALRKLFSEHREYRIVHGHLGSTAYWYLGEAARQGVKWRILHGHCPGYVRSPKGYIKHALFFLSPRYANIRLACSKEAGIYQFRSNAFECIPNGIDVHRYAFSKDVREAVRKELGISNCFVIGHVGRFHREKNHDYLIEIFAELKKRTNNIVLLLLGDGTLMQNVQEKAKALGVRDSVLFMGLIKDCAPYYQAMDVFILPSLYEGLPLTGIEAQCAALPCLFSDSVSAEAKISSNVKFLPIGERNVTKWVDGLLEIRQEKAPRAELPPEMKAFDAVVVAQNMAERYKTLWEREI